MLPDFLTPHLLNFFPSFPLPDSLPSRGRDIRSFTNFPLFLDSPRAASIFRPLLLTQSFAGCLVAPISGRSAKSLRTTCPV